MNTTLDIIAIGKAVCEIQQSPERILATARELGIHPAIIINGVPHFSRPDLAILAERFYPVERAEQ